MNLSSPPAGALRAAVIGAGAGHAHWVSAGSAEPGAAALLGRLLPHGVGAVEQLSEADDPGRDGSVFVITAKTRLC